jgi:hypothetical protein
MRDDPRFAMIFSGACIGGVYAHELGHAVAGWVQGIPVLPTPFKEYILQDQVEWAQQIWISLGGVAATVLLVVGTLIWYARERRSVADAVLAGVLLTPCVYTIRFLLVGRGHDGLEWQEAQSALGAAPSGHAVDVLFLCLSLVGSAAWMVRRRSSLRPSSVIEVTGLMLGGIALLMTLQVVNNALFDRFCPETRTVNVPALLESR